MRRTGLLGGAGGFAGDGAGLLAASLKSVEKAGNKGSAHGRGLAGVRALR